jgi:hypothetical protein
LNCAGKFDTNEVSNYCIFCYYSFLFSCHEVDLDFLLPGQVHFVLLYIQEDAMIFRLYWFVLHFSVYLIMTNYWNTLCQMRILCRMKNANENVKI